MRMLAILAVVFPVFALILIGWAIGRRRMLPRNAVEALNGFVVKLALPVLLFQFVAEADWQALWHPAFVAALSGSMAIAFVATLGFATRDRPVADRSIDALAAAYANTAFIGIPIGQALFGTVGIAAAVIASLLTIALLFAISILLVEIDLHRSHGLLPAAIGVAKSVLSNPLVIGPLAGAGWALTGLALPDPLHRLAMLLGGAASPVALVTIGLFLANAPAGGVSARVTPLVAIKLVGHPLATLGLVWLLGVPAPWGAAAVLIAALPTGTGPFMLATLYDREANVTARVILISTLLSCLTIPLLALWLR